MISFVMAAIFATTTVYRLELTDDVPYIVGQDGVRREVCLVDPTQYALMTGQVAKVWQSLNSTDSGRTQLHGSRISTEIDTTNGTKTVVYKDGYRHQEKFVVRTQKKIEDFAGINRKPKKPSSVRVRNQRISERQQKFREALEERKAAPVKTVTVEHDAATGKDIVK